MRILILASYAPSLINFRGPLISALLKEGHEVCVGAPNLNEGVRSELRKLGAIVNETPMDRHGMGFASNIRYVIGLFGTLKKTKPDLVLTYTIKPNIFGAFSAKACRIRSVAMITGLGYAFTVAGKWSLKKAVARFVARRLYRIATNANWRVIFQNPDDLADFVESGCLADTGKAQLINGSGVDLCHYTRAPLPDTPIFLMISRILGAKGVREYAQAAKTLKRANPQARFRLVGFIDSGPDAISRVELEEWIANGVEYLGSTDDVRPYLAASRVFVLPSYREGTPRSVLEAMAMGRPVITTDAPGCRETVLDGENGFLIPVGDSEALADAMQRFIDDPSTAPLMGQRSYAIAHEKYDVHKVNAAILKIMGL